MKAFIPKNDARGFIMPNFIFDDIELKCGAKVLFSMLCDYARDRSFCYLSLQTLANRLNSSLNTVKAYLQQLEELGYIKIKKSLRGLVYYLFRPQKLYKNLSKIDTNKKLSPCNSKGNESKMSKIDENLSNIDTKVNVNKLNNLIPPIVPHQKTIFSEKKEYEKGGGYISFEEFWNVYPKKENYEKAKKAFFYARRKNTLPTVEFFKNAVEFFLKDSKWQRENGRFIPQLHNFINDLRWSEYKENTSSDTQTLKDEKLFYKASYETFEERTERFLIQAKEKEDEEKKKTILREKWLDFTNNFLPDSTLNRFIAERYFYRYHTKNNTFLEVTSFQNMTAYEYMKQFNLME